MDNIEEVDTTIYKVVVNHEEQYSIWPDDRNNPLGWNDVGKSGSKAECLDYINEVWIDMRPLSLRKEMEEIDANRELEPPPEPPRIINSTDQQKEDTLVNKLASGGHRVEVTLRPEKTLEQFKECINRNYVHIKFTQTQGGTELGVRLDQETSKWSEADFETGRGKVHLEGELVLNYIRVKCVADIVLETLQGEGYLVPIKEVAPSRL